MKSLPSLSTRFRICVFATLTSLACSPLFAGRVALVAAYQGELDAILELIEDEKIEETVLINGTTFFLGEAYGKQIIVFKTNVSTVNAAMTTQLALSHFEIDTLLFSGIAGGINPELEKGDVAIPKKWYYHAESAYFNETEPGSGEYLVPERIAQSLHYDNFGMHHPRIVRAARAGMTRTIPKASFDADDDLLTIAQNAVDTLQASSKTSILNARGEASVVKIGGAGVAGPVFMDNAEYREFIFKNWQADSLDMESTAIAHVCWSNGVPFLIVRALSDLAGGQKGHNEIAEHARSAERNAARILSEILKEL